MAIKTPLSPKMSLTELVQMFQGALEQPGVDPQVITIRLIGTTISDRPDPFFPKENELKGESLDTSLVAFEYVLSQAVAVKPEAQEYRKLVPILVQKFLKDLKIPSPTVQNAEQCLVQLLTDGRFQTLFADLSGPNNQSDRDLFINSCLDLWQLTPQMEVQLLSSKRSDMRAVFSSAIQARLNTHLQANPKALDTVVSGHKIEFKKFVKYKKDSKQYADYCAIFHELSVIAGLQDVVLDRLIQQNPTAVINFLMSANFDDSQPFCTALRDRFISKFQNPNHMDLSLVCDLLAVADKPHARVDWFSTSVSNANLYITTSPGIWEVAGDEKHFARLSKANQQKVLDRFAGLPFSDYGLAEKVLKNKHVKKHKALYAEFKANLETDIVSGNPNLPPVTIQRWSELLRVLNPLYETSPAFQTALDSIAPQLAGRAQTFVEGIKQHIDWDVTFSGNPIGRKEGTNDEWFHLGNGLKFNVHKVPPIADFLQADNDQGKTFLRALRDLQAPASMTPQQSEMLKAAQKLAADCLGEAEASKTMPRADRNSERAKWDVLFQKFKIPDIHLPGHPTYETPFQALKGLLPEADQKNFDYWLTVLFHFKFDPHEVSHPRGFLTPDGADYHLGNGLVVSVNDQVEVREMSLRSLCGLLNPDQAVSDIQSMIGFLNTALSDSSVVRPASSPAAAGRELPSGAPAAPPLPAPAPASIPIPGAVARVTAPEAPFPFGQGPHSESAIAAALAEGATQSPQVASALPPAPSRPGTPPLADGPQSGPPASPMSPPPTHPVSAVTTAIQAAKGARTTVNKDAAGLGEMSGADGMLVAGSEIGTGKPPSGPQTDPAGVLASALTLD